MDVKDLDKITRPGGKGVDMKTIEELQVENDELIAHCEWLSNLAILEARNHDTIVKELTGTHNNSEKVMTLVIKKTDKNKSANEIKAQAIMEAANSTRFYNDDTWPSEQGAYCSYDDLSAYAKKLIGAE